MGIPMASGILVTSLCIPMGILLPILGSPALGSPVLGSSVLV